MERKRPVMDQVQAWGLDRVLVLVQALAPGRLRPCNQGERWLAWGRKY